MIRLAAAAWSGGTGVTAGHDLVMRRRRGLDTLEGRAAQA